MTVQATWLNYRFEVYPAGGTTWRPVPGVYIFAGMNAYRQWVALYIGQAGSLANRFSNHERWPAAARLGATHVHALVVPLQVDRDFIERSLIQAYQPHLNQNLRFAS